jgi:hypothetical protein
MEEGCPEHGSDHMTECTACGEEFCTLCNPRTSVCPDCAEGSGLDEEARGEDFEDVGKLDKLLDENEYETRTSSGEEESP